MALLTTEEIEKIKADTDLAAVVRSRGVALAAKGGDLVGLCPFHEDKSPSLHVTPAKRLWRCVSCNATGNVIQFVQRFDGVSFRHAADLLAGGAAFKAPPTCGPVKKSTVPRLANPLAGVTASVPTTSVTAGRAPDPATLAAEHAADQEALRCVLDYYAERLTANPSALAYLEKRGLADPELLRVFRIGYCDRTLGLRLPQKNRAEGAVLRGRLERLGLMRETGHEHFRGQIVIPILSAAGEIGTIYGRAAGKVEKADRHRFLPGPQAGFFNPAALSPDTLRESKAAVILTEGITDALTWWAHGFRNVTTCYSARKPSPEVIDAIVKAGVRLAFLAFDADNAGDAGTEGAAALLLARGVECRRVRFPHGHDANSYALAVKPPRQALAVLLNAAEWLGRGQAVPAPVVRGVVAATSLAASKPEVSATASPSSDPACVSLLAASPALSSLAAKAAKAADVGATQNADKAPPTPPPSSAEAAKEKTLASVVPLSGSLTPSPTATPPLTPPAAPSSTPSLTQRGEHWFLDLDGREYRVGGLEKTLGGDAIKIALRLRVGSESQGGEPRFHLDGIDLARDAERRRFVERAAEETGLHADLLRRDLARLLFAVEAAQTELAKPATTTAPTINLTAQERAAALDLLRAPDLLARILRDFDACGVVGEETNKLVGYLAAVSRKLANPLAIIVQSTSAAGKSALMEAVLAFVPPEERVKYSALTGQALYYLGGDSNLKHKILAIVEEEGAEKASYALKLLQSEGELSIASTGKDPHTGRMVTQEYRVEGPVMIFLTTTAVDIDEELLNRCLILTVDEGREQTAAIHRLQRERETLAGLLRTEARAAVLALHRNAQRLLRPLRVVNPYAERLTFQDDRTRSRRDHTKYLALIRVITLLHQYQRPVKTADDDHGNAVEYIEVTLDDIAAANRLAHDVLGRCLDEMPPQTRRLLAHLSRFVAERAKVAGCERANVLFTRREIRVFTGWGDTQLRIHLDRLVSLEYLLPHRGDRGQSFVYELLYDGDGQDGGKHLPGLLDVEKLRRLEARATRPHGYGANLAGVNDDLAGSSRGQNGGIAGGSRPDEKPDSPSETPPPKPADDENPRPRDDDQAAA
jgi:DNA primase